jgi:hypothetical protein
VPGDVRIDGVHVCVLSQSFDLSDAGVAAGADDAPDALAARLAGGAALMVVVDARLDHQVLVVAELASAPGELAPQVTAMHEPCVSHVVGHVVCAECGEGER